MHVFLTSNLITGGMRWLKVHAESQRKSTKREWSNGGLLLRAYAMNKYAIKAAREKLVK
jgi:hypothetical protein